MFTGIQLYEGNEKFYRQFVMPCFRVFDAETSHRLAVKAAKYKLVPKPKKPPHPVLVSVNDTIDEHACVLYDWINVC